MIRGILSTIFMTVFCLVFVAGCSSSDNSSPVSEQEVATSSDNVLKLGDDIQTEMIGVDVGTGEGTIQLTAPTLNADILTDKILLVPSPDGAGGQVAIRVDSVVVSDEPNSDGNMVAQVKYSIPALDEIIDEVDFELPNDALENSEITHVFYPQSFSEDQTSLAARGVQARDGYRLNWFPEVKPKFDYTNKDDNKGSKLKITGFTIVEYVKSGSSEEGEDTTTLGKLTLDGLMDITINSIENTIKKDSLTDLNNIFLINYTQEREISLTLSGDFEASLASIDDLKSFKCGVSKVSTGEYWGAEASLSGAKWNENLCLGGFRLTLSTIPLRVLVGNGDAQKTELPVSLDVFFTMNLALEVKATAKVTFSETAEITQGSILQNGEYRQINSAINPNDPDGELGINTSIEGELKAEISAGVGVAAGVKVAGVYPAVLEAGFKSKFTSELTSTFDGLDQTEVGCWNNELDASLEWSASLGLSAELSSKVDTADAEKTKFGFGFNYKYTGEWWGLDNPTIYDSCANDKYEVKLPVEQSDDGGIIIGYPVVTGSGDGANYTVSGYEIVLYDREGQRVTSYSDGESMWQLDDLHPNNYRYYVYAQLSNGDMISDSGEFTASPSAPIGALVVTKQLLTKYSNQVTWQQAHKYADVYAINLETNERERIKENIDLGEADTSGFYFGYVIHDDLTTVTSVQYRYEIVAKDLFGLESSVAEAVFIELDVSSEGGVNTVTWSAVPGNSYDIAFTNQSLLESPRAFQVEEGVTSPFNHSGIGSNEYWFYKIRYTNESGFVSPWSAEVEMLSPEVVISAPQNLTASTSDSQITFRWNDVSESDQYTLYLAETAGVTPENYSSKPGGRKIESVSNPYVVTGLENGTVYYTVVTASKGSVESPASDEVSATPKQSITSVSTGKLNDTGITQCADGSTNGLSCPVTGYPDQDAQYGRDFNNNDDSDGHAGFSFTKLDTNGNELLANATEWSCVKDNITGLIWEVKQGGNGSIGDEGRHDADDRYNWYSTDTSNDGGHPGYQDDDGAICHGYSSGNPESYCNTEAYASRVNAQSLCGSSDWRLPTREELRSIVSYDIAYPGPTIDAEYFPNTINFVYWSSSPYANGSSHAWNVYFSYGYDYADAKHHYYYVRLVRGGQ